MNRPWFLGVSIGLLLLAPQTSPAQSRSLQPNIQSQLHRAETAWRSGGSLLEAKVRADEVLRANPDHPEALKLRADVLLALDRYNEALRDARRATELDPTDGRAYWILAESARLSGDLSTTRDALREAAGMITDDNAEFHVMLSGVAMNVEELELAESFARVARAREPTHAAAHYQLARVFILQGRLDDAVTILLGGLNEQFLDPRFIREDSTLGSLSRHPALAPALEKVKN
jgi:predicted Zn-dependent protease